MDQGATDVAAKAGAIDLVRLRAYRLGRLREQLRIAELPACVLADPVNIRYATGTRNMQVYCLRNPARYVFVPIEGPVVLFEFHNCEHLSKGIETVDEVRPATTWTFFKAGDLIDERARRWADEIADLYHRHCGRQGPLAMDKVNPAGAVALAEYGIEVVDAGAPVERARAIKSTDEIACMTAAIEVCQAGFGRMREALQPGITEQALWAHLHAANIEGGGEYIETRMLTSGPRTNPWFQEASDRAIEAGDLVACDSDLIGVHGYFADMSRTFFCEPGQPTGTQRNLYQLAYEQIHHNIDLIRPGLTFREFAEISWPVPDAFKANRYSAIVHGVGLSGEYPAIVFGDDFDRKGYDGVIKENMTLSVESFIGRNDGGEGVKLEEIVHVTSSGAKALSTFPYEETLLI
jgi:Xaa-Pro dipeptidase